MPPRAIQPETLHLQLVTLSPDHLPHLQVNLKLLQEPQVSLPLLPQQECSLLEISTLQYATWWSSYPLVNPILQAEPTSQKPCRICSSIC